MDWQHPDRCRPDRLGLLPKGGARRVERQPVGADAKDGQHLWPVAVDCGLATALRPEASSSALSSAAVAVARATRLVMP